MGEVTLIKQTHQSDPQKEERDVYSLLTLMTVCCLSQSAFLILSALKEVWRTNMLFMSWLMLNNKVAM